MALPTNGPNKNNGEDKTPANGALPKPPSQGSVGYSAPRGGLPTPTSPLQRSVAPAPAPPEDDAFEQLTVDEVLDETDFYEDYEAPPAPRVEPEPVVEPEPEPTPAPKPTADEFDGVGEDEPSTFINKKKGKLLPFGGSKSNKEKKGKDDLASTFDARENRRTKARLIQGGALLALFSLVGFGGYNAINPPTGASLEEVNAAVSYAIQANSFPIERGAAFSEDFLASYLQFDESSNSDANNLLGYYYTGVIGSEAPPTTRNNTGVSQIVVVQPKVFKQVALTADSAYYELGAFVQTIDPNAPVAENSDAPTTGKWVFYNVNVYYDENSDVMAITPDSPTLMPNHELISGAELPEPKLLGTGEPSEEMTAQVSTSLNGFFEAFAKSSVFETSSLKQYVLTSQQKNAAVMRGLNGEFVLDGDPESAIQAKAFLTEDPNKVKVDVTVIWADADYASTSTTDGSTIGVQYTGRYFVEMTKADGKWFVSNFAPKYYTPAGS